MWQLHKDTHREVSIHFNRLLQLRTRVAACTQLTQAERGLYRRSTPAFSVIDATQQFGHAISIGRYRAEMC
jgi:hypothetical protein